jgi:hypothetical protein
LALRSLSFAAPFLGRLHVVLPLTHVPEDAGLLDLLLKSLQRFDKRFTTPDVDHGITIS